MANEMDGSSEYSATSPGSGSINCSTPQSSGPPTPESLTRKQGTHTGQFGNTIRTYISPRTPNHVPSPQIRQSQTRGQIRPHVQIPRGPPWVQGPPVVNRQLERNPLHLHHQASVPPFHLHHQQQTRAPPLHFQHPQHTRAGSQHIVSPVQTQRAADAHPRLHSVNKAKRQRDPSSYSDYQHRTRAQPGEQAQREQLGARFRERQVEARNRANQARAEKELEAAKSFEDDDIFIPNIKH
ncbi:hypothetical protein FHL15_006526 [Xylaria flabelliformis]|uniref:Uncharacterized protein n=1 Tax=Xylaria flabelliformis TaxID=2512241 RepID=A0A553HXC0_9PEZI|nr:hypothetical protein FHL15_006526 [Xylaria flabelliformis]